jgi:ubiquinone/menaquinone biosynthesis C-methylase UbiE
VSKVHGLKKYDWCSKRDVMKYYNTIASSYTELHGTEQQLKFRAALTHTSVTGNAILDLGCGTGLFFSFVSTPLRDSIFDTVFAFTLLQNVASPHHTLQEVSRVLKPNSNFMLSSLKTFFSCDVIVKLLRRSHLLVTKWLSTTSKDYLAICKKVTFYSKNTR